MKRIGNLYEKIISVENLKAADQRARKGKSKQYGVISHLKNEEDNIYNLHVVLRDESYKTSAYKMYEVFEPKHRIISKLPYYP